MEREEFGARHLVGQRLKPFGQDWRADGASPYRQLLVRVQRLAYREFVRHPELSDEEFRQIVGREFFGGASEQSKVSDLLFLQEGAYQGRNWASGSPLVQPQILLGGGPPEKWPRQQMAEYGAKLRRLREITERYERAASKDEQEMHHIAAFVLQRWRDLIPSVLDSLHE
jgi:hypothetical protein